MRIFFLLLFFFPFVATSLQAQTGNFLYQLINEGRIAMSFPPFQRDTVGEASLRNHQEWAAVFLRDSTFTEVPAVEVFHRETAHPANGLLSGYSAYHRYHTVLEPRLKEFLAGDSSASLGSFESHLPFLEQHKVFRTPYAFVIMDGAVLTYALEQRGALVWEFYGRGDEKEFIYSLLDDKGFLMHLEALDEEYETKLACHSIEIGGETYHAILFSISLESI